MNFDLPNLVVALVALVVSIVALGLSFYFWRRQFRPIVTAAVRTHAAGNMGIVYDLVLLNSGSIPAKNIRLQAEGASLASALGPGAIDKDKELWLACFKSDPAVSILQNGDRMSCSFGNTTGDDRSFWKPHATISIVITYEGWFGGSYRERQTIQIADSNSFTGHYWGESHRG